MKKLALLAAAVLATSAIAKDKADKAPESKGVAAGEVTTALYTVEMIDQATRTVTLKGKDGKSFAFVAGPEVRNLAQVEKGDHVKVAYIEAVALALKKAPGTVRERTETEIKEGAALGQKPAGIVGKSVRVVASVEALDAKAGKVTLRGPQRTVELKVKDPAVLKNVKVGDFVEAEFVEAMAVKVEKAPAAPAKKK